jgi:hypothetical protein
MELHRGGEKKNIKLQLFASNNNIKSVKKQHVELEDERKRLNTISKIKKEK